MLTRQKSWTTTMRINVFLVLFATALIVTGEDAGMPTPAPIDVVTDPPVIVTPAPAVVTPAPVTDAPTDNPTTSPILITPSPTISPSAFPTKNPTKSPTKLPTTDQPSEAPSASPTLAPVITTPAPVITSSPTSTPSEMPSKVPTKSPTIKPTTMSPSETPSQMPTRAPIVGTLSPTVSQIPTTSPTKVPSEIPSSVPSVIPTLAPIFGTRSPSVAPSSNPTTEERPSSTPTEGDETATASGLEMQLLGPDAADFTDESNTSYQSITEEYVTQYFVTRPQLNVDVIETKVTVTDIVDGSSTRARRGLQGSSVTIVYSQETTYRSDDPNVNAEFLTTEPFIDEASRDEYATLLVDSDAPGLVDVESVSEVAFTPQPPTEAPAPPSTPTDPPTPDNEDSGLSLGAIIGIAAGGGALLIGIGAYFYFKTNDKGGAGLVDANEQVDTYIVKEAGPDEISTLGPPQDLTENVMRYGGGYEDPR